MWRFRALQSLGVEPADIVEALHARLTEKVWEVNEKALAYAG